MIARRRENSRRVALPSGNLEPSVEEMLMVRSWEATGSLGRLSPESRWLLALPKCCWRTDHACSVVAPAGPVTVKRRPSGFVNSKSGISAPAWWRASPTISPLNASRRGRPPRWSKPRAGWGSGGCPSSNGLGQSELFRDGGSGSFGL